MTMAVIQGDEEALGEQLVVSLATEDNHQPRVLVKNVGLNGSHRPTIFWEYHHTEDFWRGDHSWDGTAAADRPTGPSLTGRPASPATPKK